MGRFRGGAIGTPSSDAFASGVRKYRFKKLINSRRKVTWVMLF